MFKTSPAGFGNNFKDREMRIVILLSSIIILTSCLKEESPIPKREPGGIVTNQVSLGTNYEFQAYFDLSTNQVTGINSKDIEKDERARINSLILELVNGKEKSDSKPGAMNYICYTATLSVSTPKNRTV